MRPNWHAGAARSDNPHVLATRSCCAPIRLELLWVTADRVFAEALLLVASSDRYDIARTTDLTSDAILREVRERRPQVVFLDLENPTLGAPSVDLVARLCALGPRVVVLAPRRAVDLRARCVLAGADGFASRTDSLDELLVCVARATSGQCLLPLSEVDALLRAAADISRRTTQLAAALDALSTREQDVLRGLMRGLVAKQIARELVVSLATVRSHIRSILAKLDVGSQVEAIAVAHRVG
jgi:two-component system, NarL family, nitrate/nitrite response regulator NarL